MPGMFGLLVQLLFIRQNSPRKLSLPGRLPGFPGCPLPLAVTAWVFAFFSLHKTIMSGSSDHCHTHVDTSVGILGLLSTLAQLEDTVQIST